MTSIVLIVGLLSLLISLVANPVYGTCELQIGGNYLNMSFSVQTLHQAVSSQTCPDRECPMESRETEIREYIQNLSEMVQSTLERLESDRKSTSVCKDDALFLGDLDMQSGSCYRFDLVLLNWAEGREYCQRKGYHLVSIETSRENEFIIGTMPGESNPIIAGRLTEDQWPGFWTSASDEGEEGTWVWTATGEPMTYKLRDSGEPNDYEGKQDHMYTMVGTGRWTDMPGSTLVYPLCERKVLLSC